MDKYEGKVAVVTGASVGIGAAISKALVQKGLLVVAIARRIIKLEELAKSLTDEAGKLYPVRCDVAREENILRAFEWIKINLGAIHVLINNAGIIRPTTLIDGSTEEWRKTVDVNVMAVCICSREAISNMRENNVTGQIINMNSYVGHTVPNLPANIYPATKFAVTALTESLRWELLNLKCPIRITSLSPGVVKTDFQIGMIVSEDGESVIENAKFLNPEDIVDSVLYILSTPLHVHIQELTIKPVGEPF